MRGLPTEHTFNAVKQISSARSIDRSISLKKTADLSTIAAANPNRDKQTPQTQHETKRTRHQPLSDNLRGRVPKNIWHKTNANLHITEGHPLDTLRRSIETYLHKMHPSLFQRQTSLSPIVTTTESFDDLLVPADHISRHPSDTFYITDNTLLRPHMTAHDAKHLRNDHAAALLCGDVYRRDTVDRTHYPVFHQLDAYRLYPARHDRNAIEQDLKNVLENLGRMLFGRDADLRWVDAYFPFTTPSFELEVFWKGDWLEVLGCGLLHRGVLRKTGVPEDVNGWAFGLGLERLAMVLFDIPDIRLFWSNDERFLSQFRDGNLAQTFQPFSAYPGVEKHVSFWLDDTNFHENDFNQVVRAVGGDLVEDVRVIDRFDKDGRTSLCFSVMFRSIERNLTHVEVNHIYDRLRQHTASALPVTLR